MSESNKFRFLSLFGANYQAINDGIQSAIDEANNILDNMQGLLEAKADFIKLKSTFETEFKKLEFPPEEFDLYKYSGCNYKKPDADCTFYFGFFVGSHLNNCACKEVISPKIYFITGLWIRHDQQMDKYVVKNKIYSKGQIQSTTITISILSLFLYQPIWISRYIKARPYLLSKRQWHF